MVRLLISAALLAMLALPARAECYLDYKAKRDDPLRLHYGVIDLPETACSIDAATPLVSARLAAVGWQLLQIVSIFGSDDLASRRSDAGSYFLRF